MLALLLAATISANAIKAHIDFLASDQLEGRETGSRGFDIAAHYVAAQFESIGLEPAGDDGTFFQKIEFRSAQVDESRSTMTINEATLVNRTDVIFSPIFSGDDATIDAPIVFAGFGAPDDYANIDARGKIVLVLSGANPKLPNDERAYYSSRELKRETAAAHGAIGMI